MSDLPDLRPRRLGAPGSLPADWLAGDPAARSLLPPPASAGALPDRAGEARLSPGAFGTTGEGARRKLERILAGDGWLVTTGQQPVLFLGPLYVLYKAVTAVQLAEHLEARTGRPVLASFWIASDDHDWEEVAGTRLLDVGNELRELRVAPPPGREGRPVGPSPLPEAVKESLDDLSQALPHSEFVDDYLDLFRETYVPGRAFSEAFAGALGGLLGGRDLAWLDAAGSELKRAAVPLLERALREGDGARAALLASTDDVRAAGHDPPIPLLEGAAPVFVDTGEGRERVYVEQGRARRGRGGEPAPLEALLERLRSEPDRFSPNVSLRPVLESWLFPVGATVLGPGELSYWAQLPGLFRWAGVAPPSVAPRGSWTLVESKVAKVLEKVDAEPEDLSDGGRSLVERETRRSRPAAVDEALAALRGGAGKGLQAVEDAVEAELPGIRSAVGKARQQVFGAVDELEARVDARVRERRDVIVQQIEKAAVHLFPDGRPQERVINPIYYLARYGAPLLEALESRTRVAVESWAE